MKNILSSQHYLTLVTDYPGVDISVKNNAREEFEKYREVFLQGAEDIVDDDDFSYYVAVKYVEVKANWIQYNLRLNYQAVLKGAADQSLLLRAGLLSHFLSLVEPSVENSHLDLIQELLATRLAA